MKQLFLFHSEVAFDWSKTWLHVNVVMIVVLVESVIMQGVIFLVSNPSVKNRLDLWYNFENQAGLPYRFISFGFSALYLTL